MYLPGLMSIPAVDRDEARFAQASRQMLESGDYVVPRVQGRPRLNKPPVIYWLQAGAAHVLTRGDPLHDAVWMYRVPSFLAAVCVVMLTWRLGGAMYGPFAGVLSAAIVGLSPVFFWEAHQARADMALVAATLCAVWALWNCTAPPDQPARRPPWRWVLLLWAAIALGVMTKGPVTPMVVGLGSLALCLMTRSWRWLTSLRPLLGLLILAAAVAPWVYLVSKQVGWNVYLSTIIDETLGRSLEPKEGHGGFPGYHAVLLPALLFPGSLLVGLAAWEAWKARRLERPALFLLCMIAPSWLVFEAVGTKLPHYTMPLYPMLAILTARVCCVGAAAFSRYLTLWPVRWATTLWLLAVPGFVLLGAAVFAANLPRMQAIGALSAGAGIAAVFLGSAAWALRRRDLPLLMAAGLLAAVPAFAGFGDGLHRLNDIWISRELAAHLRKLDPGAQVGIAAVGSDPARAWVGFHEDSLIFETRGRIQRIEPADLDAWFARNPGGYAVVPAAMLINNPAYIPIAAVDGFNYSKGKRTYLCIAGERP